MPRVLVVDDDKSVRAVIKAVLEHQGFDVVVAEDGRGGIAAIQSSAFDVVIVDIFMPGMDGLETIRVFNKYAPTVPVIAISGFMFRNASAPAPDFLSMATKLGAAYSLHKPFRTKDLLSAVAACLGAPAQAIQPEGTAEPELRKSG